VSKHFFLPSADEQKVQTMRTRFFTLCCLLLAGRAFAQDLHFSQFYHNPMHGNPAATGVFRGDLRAAALYRSQWAGVPVSYQSFAGGVDWKAIRRGNNMVSLGFLLQHDEAGDAGLRWNQAGFSGSVAHALGTSQAISVGFGLAFVQRSVDLSGLKFKNQWTGDVFDPSLPSNEALGRRSGLRPSLSAGLNWHYEPTSVRSRFSAGVGVFHLNRPAIHFLEDRPFLLPMRICLNLQGALQLGERLDAVAFGSAQQMRTAREIEFGAGLRRILSEGPGSETAVQFSLATRLADAVIPAVQLERNNWTLGLSYDVNISGFDTATNGRGGIEVALVYRTLPVPPVKAFKACPIF